jgi:hypothetical protein
MDPKRRYRGGDEVEVWCGFCGQPRPHLVSIADGDGRILRAVCDVCKTEHPVAGSRPPAIEPAALPGRTGPGRPGPRPTGRADAFPSVTERERSQPVVSIDGSNPIDLELLIRRVLREESGLTAVVPADKWRGGQLVLKPGREGVQEKTWPIETFFHKVVMIRNRLRTLEQQVNSTAEVPDAVKVKLQAYITACYGSLTSFNVLFADPDDHFRGAGGGDR